MSVGCVRSCEGSWVGIGREAGVSANNPRARMLMTGERMWVKGRQMIAAGVGNKSCCDC